MRIDTLPPAIGRQHRRRAPPLSQSEERKSCDAEVGREDGRTQVALCLTFSTGMELLRSRGASRGALWLLASTFAGFFGSGSCFGSNLDSEFTFLLPAGRSECFFQTAIKNGTMEVEYQVTATGGRKHATRRLDVVET